MQKRRERIERWRAERKKKEQELTKREAQKGTLISNLTIPQGAVKKWSLENDSDEEEEEKGEGEAEAEVEIDPLDAFMQGKLIQNLVIFFLIFIIFSGVHDEVRKINKLDIKKDNGGTSDKGGVVIVTGVAKKATTSNRGELIEENQDGLEYSSEEEQEDLKDTAASIANKQKKELAKVDHTEMNYITFRKNFYVEVPEIARMTTEEVEAYKEELEGIRVKGKE